MSQTYDERFDELKPWALENLRTRAEGVTVVFTKADGTERTMRCTLFESNIPKEKQPKSETENSSTSGSTIRVFDLEKEEWRSFRWESVKRITLDI